MEPILNGRTLKAIQRSSHGLSGRLFSRMHPFGQEVIEVESLFLALALNRQWLFEADRRSAAWSGHGRVVGESKRNNLHVNASALSQLCQPDSSLLQLNRSIGSVDATLRKDDQLLAIFKQVERESQGRQGRFVLIDCKTAKTVQKPSLQS